MSTKAIIIWLMINPDNTFAFKIVILCAKAIYLKAALSIEETNSSRKALTNEQLEKKLKQGNVLNQKKILLYPFNIKAKKSGPNINIQNKYS